MYVSKVKSDSRRRKLVSATFKTALYSKIGNLKKWHNHIARRVRPKTMTCIRTFNYQHHTRLPQSRASLHRARNCLCCQRLDSFLEQLSLTAAMASSETDDDTSQDETDDVRTNINNLKTKKKITKPRQSRSLTTSPITTSGKCNPKPVGLAENKENNGIRPRRPYQPQSALIASEKIYSQNSTSLPREPVLTENIFKTYRVLLITVLIIVLPTLFYFSTQSNNSLFNLKDEISKLNHRYGQSTDFWDRIESSLIITNRSEDVAVFLFVYIHTHLGSTVLEFTKEIAKTAATYFDDSSTPKDPIVVGPSEVNDPNFLVNYRETLKKTRSMVVRNVNLLPGNAARPFHFFCDDYNPLVRKSAIFLTLDITDCKNDIDLNELEDQNTLVELTEQCLFDTWERSLASEYLKPLVARVVNVVLLVDTTNKEIFSP